jgi:dienelactone hydrolase
MESCTMKTFRPVLIVSVMGIVATTAVAEVVTESVEYDHDGLKLVGYLAYDDSLEAPAPGVLVVHEWWGLNDYAKRRARMLAELGYVAFVADMYDGGKTTTKAEQASQWAGKLYADADLWRARASAGLKQLITHKRVDASKCFAIGYCFGGSTVTQLAYAGAPLKGVVSFHGSLPTPKEGETPKIKAELLICHGEADPLVPPAKVLAFKSKLDELKAAYTFIGYADAKHAFTNPDADKAGMDAVGYNARADRRSWQHMQMFFKSLLD